jgi:alpha-tubulin suppressor-like RCC1 family protein
VLFSDGTVGGWGFANEGLLGPVSGLAPGQLKATAFVPIQLPAKAIDVAGDDYTSLAVLEDGTVAIWGSTRSGIFGPGGGKLSPVPVRMPGLSNVTQIVAIGGAAVALLKDGTVRAWGQRGSGVIGDGQHPRRFGESGPPAPSLVQVPNVSNVVRLAGGSGFVLALTADGGVLSWGSNFYGALGREPRDELPLDTVGEVQGLSGVTAIAAGLGVASALKKDGTVWAWGANWNGQFGNGDRTGPPGPNHGYQLVPQQVPGVANVTAIALGGRHTLALLKDGTLRGWGNTDWGQLGAGVSGTFQLRPVTPKITGVKAVFATGNNSIAVRNDNTLWMWGGGGPNEWPLPVNTKLPVQVELRPR